MKNVSEFPGSGFKDLGIQSVQSGGAADVVLDVCSQLYRLSSGVTRGNFNSLLAYNAPQQKGVTLSCPGGLSPSIKSSHFPLHMFLPKTLSSLCCICIYMSCNVLSCHHVLGLVVLLSLYALLKAWSHSELLLVRLISLDDSRCSYYLISCTLLFLKLNL